MNDLNIKELREKMGLTQLELAEMIGVSRNTIINYEKGGVISDAKRKILYKVLNENAQNITELNEPVAVYETNFDKKIVENEEKIAIAKKEIAELEEKIKENPDRKSTYNRYIAELEEKIFLHNKIINTILEAKDDFLNKK